MERNLFKLCLFFTMIATSTCGGICVGYAFIIPPNPWIVNMMLLLLGGWLTFCGLVVWLVNIKMEYD